MVVRKIMHYCYIMLKLAVNLRFYWILNKKVKHTFFWKTFGFNFYVYINHHWTARNYQCNNNIWIIRIVTSFIDSIVLLGPDAGIPISQKIVLFHIYQLHSILQFMLSLYWIGKW